MQRRLSGIKKDLEGIKDCKVEFDNTLSSWKKISENIENQSSLFEGINGALRVILKKCVDSLDFKIANLRNMYIPQYRSLLEKYSYWDSLTNNLVNDFNKKTENINYYRFKREKHIDEVKLQIKKIAELDTTFASLNHKLEKDAKMLLIGSVRTIDVANSLKDSIEIRKSELMKKNSDLEVKIENYTPDPYPYFRVAIIAISMLIIAFGAWVYFLALRRKRKRKGQPGSQETVKKTPQSSNGRIKVDGINIIPGRTQGSEISLSNKGRGLGEVYGKVGTEFYEIDLGEIWKDTVVRKVLIHRSCIKKTWKFFLESLETKEGGKVLETGGYLIGRWDNSTTEAGKFDVSLEDFIEPGDDAIYGEYQLNFGAKISVRLDRIIQDYKEKTGMDLMLMAWFHSHPGIKIFLSNHDLDVQQRITSDENRKRLLALVIDPNTQENGKIDFSTGIFSYRTTRIMNNNDGSMKYISWKSLYDWALSPVLPSLSNLYCIEMNKIFDDTKLSKIYFSEKFIIHLSTFLYENINNTEAYSYFTGKEYDDKINNMQIAVFDDLVNPINQPADNNHGLSGFLSCSDRIDEKIKSFSENPDSVKIAAMIFCINNQKNLHIFTRKTNLQFNLLADSNGIISFSELEAWITRIR